MHAHSDVHFRSGYISLSGAYSRGNQGNLIAMWWKNRQPVKRGNEYGVEMSHGEAIVEEWARRERPN